MFFLNESFVYNFLFLYFTLAVLETWKTTSKATSKKKKKPTNFHDRHHKILIPGSLYILSSHAELVVILLDQKISSGSLYVRGLSTIRMTYFALAFQTDYSKYIFLKTI